MLSYRPALSNLGAHESNLNAAAWLDLSFGPDLQPIPPHSGTLPGNLNRGAGIWPVPWAEQGKRGSHSGGHGEGQ